MTEPCETINNNNAIGSCVSDPMSIEDVNAKINVTDPPQKVEGAIQQTRVTNMNKTLVPSFEKLISRPMVLNHLDWSAGTTNFALPLFSPPNSSTWRQYIDRMAYLKSDLEVMVKIIGSPFHQGSLLVGWYPNTMDSDQLLSSNAVTAASTDPMLNSYRIDDFSITQVSSMTHIMMLPQVSNTATIRIPWSSIKTMAQKNSFNLGVSADSNKLVYGIFGQLVYVVASPLRSVDGSAPTLGVQTYVNYPHDTIEITGFTDPISEQTYNINEAELPYKATFPAVHYQMDPSIEGIGKAIASGMNLVGDVTNIATQIGGLAALFDMPNTPTSYPALVRRTNVTFANTNGLTSSHMLAYNEGLVQRAPDFWAGMDIRDYAKIPGIFRKFSVNTGQSEQTLLDSWYIGPSFCVEVGNRVNNSLQQLPIMAEIIPTPVAYSALPFMYWTGSMKYRLQFIKTHYQKCTIAVVFKPDQYNKQVSGAMYNDNTSRVYWWLCEVGDQCDFMIQIPYMGQYPMKEVAKPSLTYNAGDNTDWIDGVLTEYSGYPNCANGVLEVYLVNRLSAPNNTPTEIECLVWGSGGDDMRFSSPDGDFMTSLIRTGVNWINRLPPTLAESVGPEEIKEDLEHVEKDQQVLQSLAARVDTTNSNLQRDITKLRKDLGGVEYQMDATSVNATREHLIDNSQIDIPGVYNSPEELFGETHDQLEPLLRRSQLLLRGSLRMPLKESITQYFVIEIPVTPSAYGRFSPGIDQINDNPSVMHSTFLSYWAAAFRFWRGPMRYQFLVSPDNIGSVGHLDLKGSVLPFRYGQMNYADFTLQEKSLIRQRNSGGGSGDDSLFATVGLALVDESTSGYDNQTTPLLDSLTYYGMALESHHQQNVLDMTVPYYVPRQACSTMQGPVSDVFDPDNNEIRDTVYASSISGVARFVASAIAGRAEDLRYELYVSAGDGFRLGLPTCPPRLYIQDRGQFSA